MQPDPDFGRLDAVLRRKGVPDRVPFFELYSNITTEVLEAIGKTPQTSDPASASSEADQWEHGIMQHISYMYHLGYDYINAGPRNFAFPKAEEPTAMTAQGERSYTLAGAHTIQSRAEFDRYAWPDMPSVDYTPLERVSALLPDGMKVIAGSAGILENVMWLLGYEGISYLLADNETLVHDMFEAVGSRLVEYNGRQASYDSVGAVVMGEDMGFKTQTLLSPDLYRRYVFPWHKKLADAVHEHDKPLILHSCGNLEEVIDDIIGCGWDAKHSFEDAIIPVWEAKKKYGDRIALLGGFDMDKISRMPVDEVRNHTGFLLDECSPGGGWALGTGNTVANYIPVENFLAMLDEGRKHGML
jgi:uroporphyrinogen decarboxylase